MFDSNNHWNVPLELSRISIICAHTGPGVSQFWLAVLVEFMLPKVASCIVEIHNEHILLLSKIVLTNYLEQLECQDIMM